MGKLLSTLGLPEPKAKGAPQDAAKRKAGAAAGAAKPAPTPSPQMRALVKRFGEVLARVKALEAKKVPEAAALRKAVVAAGNLATSPKGIVQAAAELDRIDARITAAQRPSDEALYSGGQQSCEPTDGPQSSVGVTPPAPVGPTPLNTDSTGLQSTGAQPVQEPVSLSVGGLPAFRFNAPAIPVASVTVTTPAAVVEISLSLRGNVTVTFPNAPPGVSTDIDRGGWRVEAQRSLGPITQGLRVSGLGTASPSIGATVGTQYNTSEVRFEPPSTMVFIGQGRVGYSVPSSRLGNVAVQGQLGFELRVTVTPTSPPAVRVPAERKVSDPKRNWISENSVALTAIGVVALVGLAVATDGFGLLAVEGLEAAEVGGLLVGGAL